MGAQLDRLRYEVFQNLFYSPMNTDFLRPTVATALTVYGIETRTFLVQTQIPLLVATALTVYGIETCVLNSIFERCFKLQQRLPFTVLKQKT